MKKFIKTLAVTVLTVLTLVLTVSAEIYGDFYYEISDNLDSKDEITITECIATTTEITVPNEIEGYPVLGIGDHAFMGLGMTSVYIEEGIVSIGADSFEGCPNLTSITIPRSVISIYASFGSTANHITIYGYADSYAQTYATENGIPFVELEEESAELTSISVTAPTKTTYNIGDTLDTTGMIVTASYSDDTTKDVTADATVDVTTLNTAGTVSVTVTYEGKTITFDVNVIDISMLTYTTSNGEVTITGCNTTTVSSIVIPSTINGYPVTSIGYKAFENHSSLKSIVLPDGIKTIGLAAFRYCKSLSSIIIPSSVTSIRQFAFSGCNSLTEIVVEEGNTNYSSDENGVLYNLGKSVIVCCPGAMTSFTIPDTVTTIGNDAFNEHRNISIVTIPSSVTSISSQSFEGCTALKSITIPDSVAIIRYNAFDGCTNLQTVIFEENSKCESIESNAFDNCKNLTSINLPESLIKIGYEAFCNCIRLPSITIPSNVESIASNAFYNCDALTTLEFDVGSKCISIGSSTFAYCESLKNATIPETVTSIGNAAFLNCTKLESITIPSGVASVGDSAFYGCNSLSSVTLVEGLTTIGEKAFFYCSSLPSITIPSSVTDIGAQAFGWCYSLSNITLKNGLINIGDSAFWDCRDLTTITIPSSVTIIGTGVFNSCESLTGIWVDEANTSYSNDENGVLFDKDKTVLIKCPENVAFKTYNVPDTVTNIENSAFNECDSLTSVTLNSGVKSIGNSAFGYCDNLISISIPNGVTSIGDFTFYHCKNLKSIVLPEGIKIIGKYAFGGCDKLSSLNIPSTVESIGEYSFAYNDSLTSITIPKGVSNINVSAFQACHNLNSVNICDGVASIDENSFYGCTSLAKVIIPKSVTSINSLSFNSCSNLTIHGYIDSYAETYATYNNIPFIPLDAITYKGVSLLLDGSLGVNVYFEYEKDYIDTSSLVLNVTLKNSDNNSNILKNISLTLEEDGKTAYATVHVSPKDIDNITIQSTLSGELTDGVEMEITDIPAITVPSYIDLLKDFAETDEDCAKALDLVIALENYCAYADAFFNDVEIEDVVLTAEEEAGISAISAPKKVGSVSGLDLYYSTLILKERVIIRHYFKPADGFNIEDYTVEGAGALTRLNENYVYVDIDNVPAHELSEQKSFTISDGENTMTASYSALNYVKFNVDNEDTSLSNVVKSIYRYSVEADKYYKLLNPDEEEEDVMAPLEEDEIPRVKW